MCELKKSRIRVLASGRTVKIEGREVLDLVIPISPSYNLRSANLAWTAVLLKKSRMTDDGLGEFAGRSNTPRRDGS